MNLKEAAHQALELLEEIHPGNMTPLAEGAWNTAITALRAALAEDAMQRLTDVHQDMEPTNKDNLTVEPVAYVTGYSKGRCIIEAVDPDWLMPVGMALYRSPTINEMETVEPVAWMHEWEGVAILNMTPPNYYGDHWKHTALYTAPPKRKPLTENQIRRIDDDTPFHEGPEWLVRFTRAIERAHGIGGEE